MMILILAWKNIWRNKKRSFIILAATAVGLAAGLFSVGIMTGMYDSMVDAAINRELGDIQIHNKDYKRDELFSQSIADYSNVVNIVKSLPNIKAVSGQTIIEGMASSASTALGVIINGVEPDEEKTTSAIHSNIVEGEYLGKKNSIVVSRKLLEKLKLRMNSKVVLSFSGSDGHIVYAAFKISGVFRTDATNFDVSNVFLRRSDLAELLDGNLPVHRIKIRVSNTEHLESALMKIRKRIPENLVVESWKDLAPELKMTAESSDLINAIFLGMILFALLFGLTNTLLMSVLDRIRDFGVLLALGMYRKKLFGMILLESLFLSATGGFIGVALGWAVTIYFNFNGIDLSIVSSGLSMYGIPSMLYPYIKSSVYFTLAVMVIFTSIFAALYPAVKAVKLKPVEAIRTIA